MAIGSEVIIVGDPVLLDAVYKKFNVCSGDKGLAGGLQDNRLGLWISLRFDKGLIDLFHHYLIKSIQGVGS